MGRWGSTTYESDDALEYFDRITDLMLKEITFRLAPEQVVYSARWIANIMAVIEMLLVFDKNDVGSLVCFMDQERAVKRWREVFFGVWDAEWDDFDTHWPFHTYTYRQVHRAVAVKWFDRLDELAAFWTSGEPNQRLSKYVPSEELPYFSDAYSVFILMNLIDWLERWIVFEVSDENRERTIDFYSIAQVWVAVDVITLLCETYSFRPLFTTQSVESWQKKLTGIWSPEYGMMRGEPNENAMYENIIASFDKLKAVTNKYEDKH